MTPSNFCTSSRFFILGDKDCRVESVAAASAFAATASALAAAAAAPSAAKEELDELHEKYREKPLDNFEPLQTFRLLLRCAPSCSFHTQSILTGSL